jgi:hypothetical protein
MKYISINLYKKISKDNKDCAKSNLLPYYTFGKAYILQGFRRSNLPKNLTYYNLTTTLLQKMLTTFFFAQRIKLQLFK